MMSEKKNQASDFEGDLIVGNVGDDDSKQVAENPLCSDPICPHTGRPMPLEKISAEWLEMLARQVEWVISELEDMVPSYFLEADEKHCERLSRQLTTFQDRLTLERVRRFAFFLNEQFCLDTPRSYLVELERNQRKK